MRQNKNRHKKLTGYIAAIILIFSLLLSGKALPIHASPEENNSSESIGYTAFGDSIAKGYSADQENEIVNYPSLIAEDLASLSKKEVDLSNYAKNGLTTTKLNSVILTDGQVLESLEKADLVTLTIGANDLMNQFKKVASEILNNNQKFYNVDSALTALQDGISANPLLLVKVVGAIGGWDYASFEEQWDLAVGTINMHKPSDCQFVVTTIYNPVSKMELPGTLNAVVENIIGKMNQIIEDSAQEGGYQVADLYDSGISDYTQSDGLHPNQMGQGLIKELIENQLDIEQVTGPIIDEDARKEAAETAARAKTAREEKAQKKAEDNRNKLVFIVLANILFFGMLILLYRYRRSRRKRRMRR